MDIRLLEETDIPQAKALWKEAFGDTDAYIEWYFANKVSPGNSLGAFDGRLVAVVHMIPLKVCVQGVPVMSSYIAGAATAADRRGKGLMRTLLYESLKIMKQRGIMLTHLYPFKHSFYEKFGWATYSYARFISAGEAAPRQGADIIESWDAELLSGLYRSMMSRFDGYIVREKREWRWRLEEHATDGGKTAVLIKGGRPAAYMLYNSERGNADVIETVFTDAEDIEPLLAYLLESGHKSVNYFIPADEKGASPYGMARIVDASLLLKAFGAQELLEFAKIRDDFAEWNNTGDGEEIDITSITKAIHQGPRPGCCGSGKNIQLYNILNRHFSQRSTCIFEQY
ncbi:MAG: enhanced intracellular survival protein Eis [Burkholderiales bacterium]